MSNVKAIKEQLRIYGCYPFAEVNARDVTTGEEITRDIIENLLYANSRVAPRGWVQAHALKNLWPNF